ncbi:MAG TPA: DUF695 domain-containing protein [Flavisolibacter sp.]|jgi:hypothetical protein|nr:DUF695 domain-containing protein [Flavisolibacter sp.]
MKSADAIYTGFEFEIEGHPALAVINTDLKKLENRSQFPYSVFIEIIPDVFNENGHPEGAEYDYLNDVEKQIIEYLEEHTDSVHVGHTTIYRTREIIFYTKDKDGVENFLEPYMQTVERENYFEIEHDPEWENVSAFYDLL